MQRVLLLLLVPLAVGVAALVAPAPARACSCGGELALVWPSDGGTMPANGLLFFESDCGPGINGYPIGIYEAWIDGTPAALVASTTDAISGLGFVLEPAPAVGSTVELSSCGSAQECSESMFGERLSYTVVEPDTASPRPPSLDPLDYALAEALLDCGDDSTPARDWTVAIHGASAADEPLVYTVSLGPAGSPPSVHAAFALGAESVDVVLRRLQEDAGKNVCAEVTAHDLAGNAAAPVSTCRALASDETLSGCACSATGGAGVPGWGLLCLVAAGLWRRRPISSQP